LAQRRVDALASYFEKRPDLFIGIKLAHAHQGIEFDDPNLLAVYDVAAMYQAPVLLHTGKTPFPGAVNEPDYYDPISLESTIMNYNGENGNTRVEFVLSHVGRGDVRSAEHSLYLAEQYDNVWLELSALGGTFQTDAEGNDVEYSEPMYVWVLDEIKNRNLVGRSLFATDGPQSSGKIREYTDQMVQAMVDAEFSADDLEKVLAGNFFDCFFGGRP
jgi:predicted TIM-barrel fold metal-dependent hydrolase